MHDLFLCLVDSGYIMGKVIAVTGRGGNLDTILVDRFKCIRLNADIREGSEIRNEIKRVEPDIVINCAAFTGVDEAEKQRRTAMEVNSAGVCNLRDNYDGPIIHISTDYIFDGTDGPYTEDAKPNPIGWYGKSKWCGEQMILEYGSPGDVIVRTTVLYGGHKPDFANVVLKKLKFGVKVDVPDVLFGSPTHVHHLAEALMKLVKMKSPPKIINISGDGVISRYDFAIKLAKAFGYPTSKVRFTREIAGIAKRPVKAGLDVTLAKKLNLPIYTVDDGVSQLFLEKAALYAQYPER